jgi:hypothetical protein
MLNAFAASFKSVASAGFWKAFIFDLLWLMSLIMIFGAFGSKLDTLTPELTSMAPLAKGLVDLAEQSRTDIRNLDVEIVKHNVGEIKSRTYSLLFRVIGYTLLALFAFVTVFSFFDFFGWNSVSKNKVKVVLLWKFWLMNLCWFILWAVVAVATGWFFSVPFNLIIICVLFILMLYFGIFIRLSFFETDSLKAALIGGLRKGFKPVSLFWFISGTLIFALLIILTFLLVGIGKSFGLLMLLLFLMFLPWRRIYLKQIHSHRGND